MTTELFQHDVLNNLFSLLQILICICVNFLYIITFNP